MEDDDSKVTLLTHWIKAHHDWCGGISVVSLIAAVIICMSLSFRDLFPLKINKRDDYAAGASTPFAFL